MKWLSFFGKVSGFYLEVSFFSNKETKKLATAPMIAKIIVFKISAATIVGAILNNVPDVVSIEIV